VNYQHKELCKIRTITTFLSLRSDKESWKEEIGKASRFCLRLSQEFIDNGYVVQSIRIVTNPFGEYLNTTSLDSARADLAFLSDLLNASDLSGMRIRFAIGEAKTAHEISLLPGLIQAFGDLCNVCVSMWGLMKTVFLITN